MIDESTEIKKHLLEKPSFYLGIGLIVIVGAFLHFDYKDHYRPSSSEVGKQIISVKDKHKAFQNLLIGKECYAVDVVTKYEDSFGNPHDAINTNGGRGSRIKSTNYLKLGNELTRIKRVQVNAAYMVNYFPKKLTYYCLKGGVNYSTPYYVHSQDFKNQTEYEQIQLADKIKAVESNKIVEQPILEFCHEGKTIVQQKACAVSKEKNDSK